MRSTFVSALKLLSFRRLRPLLARTVRSIVRNFFALQFHAARHKGEIPLSRVECPLDEKIPFCPKYGEIYHDFSPFWIRAAACLADARKIYGVSALDAAETLISGVGPLYERAAEVYRRNLSTTPRPRYLGTVPFLFIHIFDPHLLCIPSLHIMLVTWTYILSEEALRNLQNAQSESSVDKNASLVKEIVGFREHALAITDSVLLIKQHSVNCISAALYAMTTLDSMRFPPEEMDAFTDCIFDERRCPFIENETRFLVRAHIKSLYREFLASHAADEDWASPLLEFLRARR